MHSTQEIICLCTQTTHVMDTSAICTCVTDCFMANKVKTIDKVKRLIEQYLEYRKMEYSRC